MTKPNDNPPFNPSYRYDWGLFGMRPQWTGRYVDFLDWYEWLRTPSAIAWMRELLAVVDPQKSIDYPAQVAALKLKLDEANGQVKTLNDMVSKMGKQLKAATDGGE
jgi:hypothetical protein